MSVPTERLSAALADRYRIERELGQGGMATVYLAEDLKHKRKVALKVLKPELAAVLGAERFVQEITTTASLQHPHILSLFDSGTAEGFLYYVMPYIEGETLRDKLNRETQLGVDEAVRITTEVADALDYAHRHGVIHRDIKPENILLHDGRPMVADFGIALAVSAAAGGRMTETGLSLGTPHYMSPEQATAEKEITARSDVYSLASVLYEMLAGQPPHTGASAQQIITKIVTEDAAPVTRVRKSVPPNVAAAVAKALEKLPADRFDSAKSFAEALTNPAFVTVTTEAPHGAQASAPRSALIIGLAALAVVAIGVATWALTRPPPPLPVIRYELARPATWASPAERDPFAVLTSDGSRIIYPGPTSTDGEWQLWARSRDQLVGQPVPGTTNATSVAISADDRSLAIVQDGSLRRLPLEGGTPVPLAEGASAATGALAWLDDGTLLYVGSAAGRPGHAVMRVPRSGGAATIAWSSDSLFPQNLAPLPGSRGVLFRTCRSPCAEGGLVALDLRRGDARTVVADAVAGFYADGILLFVGPLGSVHAVAFDLDALATRGDAIGMPYRVQLPGGQPTLALSASGTMVMGGVGSERLDRFELVWVDRGGRESAVDSSWTFRVTQILGGHGWTLSPDGARLAIGVNSQSGDDIWIKTLPRGPAARVTFGGGWEYRPRWLADGRWVTFVSETAFAMRRADGAGGDSILWAGRADEGLVSPDGRWAVLRVGSTSSAAGGRDVYLLKLGVDSAPKPLLKEPYDEMAIALSPDGRWLAYGSDETGRLEVFVRPFPNVGDGKVQVSDAGGTGPLWSRDGRELFYLRHDNAMMAVPVGSDGTLGVGDSRVLFQVKSPLLAGLSSERYTPWDVGRDGRFIMLRAVGRESRATRSLVVVENGLLEVKAMMRR